MPCCHSDSFAVFAGSEDPQIAGHYARARVFPLIRNQQVKYAVLLCLHQFLNDAAVQAAHDPYVLLCHETFQMGAVVPDQFFIAAFRFQPVSAEKIGGVYDLVLQ